MTAAERPDVVAFVPDLMDRSRLTGLLGDRTVSVCSSVKALWQRVDAAGPGPIVVILDLSRRGAIESLPAALPDDARVIGFGPHVDHDLLARARAAGIEVVLPRSQFFGRPDSWTGLLR